MRNLSGLEKIRNLSESLLMLIQFFHFHVFMLILCMKTDCALQFYFETNKI